MYRSKDRILLTAIMDEEMVLVRAMRRSRKKATTPPLPSSAWMVYGMTKPESTSDSVKGRGLVGEMG